MGKNETKLDEFDLNELMTNYHKLQLYYLKYNDIDDEDILNRLNGALWVIIIGASIKYENVRDFIPPEMISDVNALAGKNLAQYIDKIADEVDARIFAMEL